MRSGDKHYPRGEHPDHKSPGIDELPSMEEVIEIIEQFRGNRGNPEQTNPEQIKSN